jgi:hypothetical protein
MRKVAFALAVIGVVALGVFATRGTGARLRAGDAHAAPILLFDGTGASPNDVRAFERLLTAQHLRFSTADSARLDDMPAAELRAFRLVIVPGGNFEAMGNGLAPATSVKLRDAVRDGVSYLGVCAGAFLAGDSPYNGLDLTGGKRFGFYSAEAQGIRKVAVPILTADGTTTEHYWEDGPQLDGWGAVVAKYPDGTAAVVQGGVMNGWMVLAGIHPEAPADWRDGMTFRTPVRASNDYALVLIDAALNRTRLPEFPPG